MHHLTKEQFQDVRDKIIRYCEEMYRPYLNRWLMEGYEAMLLLLAERPQAPEDMPPMPKAFWKLLDPKEVNKYEITKAMVEYCKKSFATLRATETPKEFLATLAEVEKHLIELLSQLQ